MIAAGVALLSLNTVQAQITSPESSIRFGIKTGINLANVVGEDIEDNSMRTGMYGGVYANIGLTDKIYFQPELLYSQQGVEFEIEEFEESARMNYLNIPLMFQYGITDNIRVEFGPQVGILLDAENELRVKDNGSTFSATVDAKDFTKPVDVGLNLGGTYQMDNGFNVSIRYNLGLTSIGEAEDIDILDEEILSIDLEDVRHSTLSVGVGFTF